MVNQIGEHFLGNPWYCFIVYIPLMILGGGPYGIYRFGGFKLHHSR